MPTIKEQLHLLCSDYLKTKEADIKKIIEEARDAANNETKSSAGDKYETGREVMQQEIDLNLTRLNEINRLKLAFDRILPDLKSDTAQPGSLVCTKDNNYYISISAGVLKVDGKSYYAISGASPIGAQLIGKKAGERFTLNGKEQQIASVS
jgi:transcription elongation GreA/GreB family factor